MRPAATITTWMDRDALARWVRSAPTTDSYRQRLAIQWTSEGRHAPEIAALLGTSARSVRRWIQHFNLDGPAAFDSEDHGGRRWGHLSEREERAVLSRLRSRARAGRLVTAAEIREAIEERVGYPVSNGYVYDLLHRHDWRKVVPRPRHVKADPAAQDAFKRGSRRASNG